MELETRELYAADKLTCECSGKELEILLFKQNAGGLPEVVLTFTCVLYVAHAYLYPHMGTHTYTQKVFKRM